eukprot:2830680-Rhodomonas_salina.1
MVLSDGAPGSTDRGRNCAGLLGSLLMLRGFSIAADVLETLQSVDVSWPLDLCPRFVRLIPTDVSWTVCLCRRFLRSLPAGVSWTR